LRCKGGGGGRGTFSTFTPAEVCRTDCSLWGRDEGQGIDFLIKRKEEGEPLFWKKHKRKTKYPSKTNQNHKGFGKKAPQLPIDSAKKEKKDRKEERDGLSSIYLNTRKNRGKNIHTTRSPRAHTGGSARKPPPGRKSDGSPNKRMFGREREKEYIF